MAGRAYDLNVKTANTLILAAAIINPAVGIALLAIANPGIGVAIVEGLAAVAIVMIQEYENYLGYASTGKYQDAYQACDDRAFAACRKCESAAEDYIFPLNLAAEDLCLGAEVIDLANCLLL